jgi:hypothetical protein
MAYDVKMARKDLYQPRQEPSLIDVKTAWLLMIEGKGNPNEEQGEYALAVETLYALSYAIKMNKTALANLPGYVDYVVAPLEGLWWFDDPNLAFDVAVHKDAFRWIMMIRQPDFIGPKEFETARAAVMKKKPHLKASQVRFQAYTEGKAVQAMHVGPYDDEPKTLSSMRRYLDEIGEREALGSLSPEGILRTHHEIYLSDPRKTAPEKRKTVLRHPLS